MSGLKSKLRAVGTWALVALVAALLVAVGLWRHAANLAKATKAALEASEAREKAARESAKRQSELAAKNAETDAGLRADVKAIEAAHAPALAQAQAEKEEATQASASGDVDDVVALARKMRAEGRIR